MLRAEHTRRRRFFTALLALATLAACTQTNVDEPEPPDNELTVRWWNWAAIEPNATNPISDANGEDCARNQTGDIWFLASTFGEEMRRSCVIPKSYDTLFAPVFVKSCLPDEPCTVADAVTQATYDGKRLNTLPFSTTDPVTITGGPDNLVNQSADPQTVQLAGWWIWLHNMEPGEHTLKLAGQEGDLKLIVTYTLVVE
jgi:hypothetical protein